MDGKYEELLDSLNIINKFTETRHKIAHGVMVDLKAIDLEEILYHLLTIIFSFARGFSDHKEIWEFLFSE